MFVRTNNDPEFMSRCLSIAEKITNCVLVSKDHQIAAKRGGPVGASERGSRRLVLEA